MLLAFELHPLVWFCTEIQAAAAAVVVVVVVVVLVQCKSAKDSCSLHTHCEPAAASLTLITTEGDITISQGAAESTITRQQCKSHTGRCFAPNK